MGRSPLSAPSLILLVSLLAGCGGGGGASSTVTPSAPSKTPAKVTFALKLPGKATMARVRKPFYQSQGTQGVSIDWLSTDPTKPDYAAAITFTCPVATSYPAGVTNCTTDPDGSTDYTFQLAIVPGSYGLTVTTFDAPPSNGLFTGAHQLSQGSVPITIAAGSANQIPSITFYGVTSSISFEPKPSQSHAMPYNGAFAVIGNAPVAFDVNPLDAGGFVITGTGAPALTVSEAATDPVQYFSISQAGTTNEWDFTAQQAPASATASATIKLSAGGQNSTVSVIPVQELWTTQTAGGSSSAYGVTGYALFPPSFTPGNAVDFVFDNSSSTLCAPSQSGCAWEPAAGEPNGSIAAISVQTNDLYEFSAPAVSEGPGTPGVGTAFSTSYPSNLAINASDNVFVADGEDSQLLAYGSPSSVSTPVATVSGLNGVQAVTVAPSWSSIPASLQQTVWVGDYNNSPTPTVGAFVYSGSTLTAIPVTFTSGMPLSVDTIGFDASGNLWTNDGSNLTAFKVTGDSSGVTLTPLGTLAASSQAFAGSSFGATAQGVMYLGQFGSYQGLIPYTLSGGAITAGTTFPTQAPVDAAFVVP